MKANRKHNEELRLATRAWTLSNLEASVETASILSRSVVIADKKADLSMVHIDSVPLSESHSFEDLQACYSYECTATLD